MYLSSCLLYLQNGIRQQFKNRSRGQEAGQKWLGALFWSVPRPRTPSRVVAVCDGDASIKMHPAELRVRFPMASEHMRGGKKRDEGNFFLLSSWIMQIINTWKSRSLQNYNFQVVTIPLPQIRQLFFLRLGRCSPAISVHFCLNTGLRGLNKLKQFTIIVKIENVFIFQHHMLDWGWGQNCAAAQLCAGKANRFSGSKSTCPEKKLQICCYFSYPTKNPTQPKATYLPLSLF